jgi:hypothetical protein
MKLKEDWERAEERAIAREKWSRVRRLGGKSEIPLADGGVIYNWATPSGKRIDGVRERFVRHQWIGPDGKVKEDVTKNANTGEIVKTSYDKQLQIDKK